ncbi:hypothetical protein ACGFSB_29300 [Streptomyces sp. NPDC048441]|uniref:hypothetical protein n=1 Tax=Streptomyces sp. NPDC048441 TaxID=3365552 RepID=UPI0037119102
MTRDAASCSQPRSASFRSFPAQRLRLAPHPGVQTELVAEVADRDRPAGLGHHGEDALILRRQHGLIHSRLTVRDHPHRPASHLRRYR